MTDGTVVLETSLTTNPLATPSWVSQSAYLNALSITVGRDQALEGLFQPSTIDAELENPDRRFDPLYAAGPNYGNLLPRRRMRARVHIGEQVLDLSTAGGATTPDHASLDIVGDIDLRCKISLDDWTPAALSAFISKADFGTQVSYLFFLNTDGTLGLNWSPTGLAGAMVGSNSTVAVGARRGTTLWVRAVLDVNNGAGGRTVRFYTSSEETDTHTAVTWTQLGADVVTAGVTSIFAGTQQVFIGDWFFSPAFGKIRAAAILNGIAGAAVANPVFTNPAQFALGAPSGTDAAGKTWTLVAPGAIANLYYDLASGFVEGWPQTYQPPKGALCTPHAIDAFDILSDIELEASPLEQTLATLSPLHWWKLDDPEGSGQVADTGSGRAAGTARDQAQAGLGADGVDPITQSTALLLTATGGYVDVTGDQPWSSFVALVRYDGGSLLLQDAHIYTRSALTVADKRLVRAVSGNEIEVSDATGSVQTTTNPVADTGTRTAFLLTVVRTGAGAFTIYVNGVAQATASAAAIPIPTGYASIIGEDASPGVGSLSDWSGLLQHVATFSTQLTAADALSLYEAWRGWDGDTTGVRLTRLLDAAGWPSADRDIDPGEVTLGPIASWEPNVLEHARLLEATEAGAFYQTAGGIIRFRQRHDYLVDPASATSLWTFSDQDTAGVYHYEDIEFEEQGTLIRNRVEIEWVGGTVVVTDAASITTFRTRSHQISTLLKTAAEARNLGEWILAGYAQPVTRVKKIVLNPAGDDRLWAPAVRTKIGDRVTIRKLPQGVGTAIQTDAYIEGKKWEFADGVETAVCTLTLSTGGDIGFFTWGVSTWDTTTRWA